MSDVTQILERVGQGDGKAAEELIPLVYQARACRFFSFESSRPALYCWLVTATSVIEEIKQLPRAEQSRVIRFAFELARERQLSGDKLAELAQRMAEAKDPAEAQKLREEIHHGFYGE